MHLRADSQRTGLKLPSWGISLAIDCREGDNGCHSGVRSSYGDISLPQHRKEAIQLLILAKSCAISYTYSPENPLDVSKGTGEVQSKGVDASGEAHTLLCFGELCRQWRETRGMDAERGSPYVSAEAGGS